MTQEISSRGYVYPESLVSTDWVAANLNDSAIRIVESNEDPLIYRSGHIPGAVEIDWAEDLNDPVRRDYLDKTGFEALMSSKGITPATKVVFYGDKNNWWACYAFWIFQLFGHTNAVIMDGGSAKWRAEDRPLETAVQSYSKASYAAPERNDAAIRAFRDQVLAHSNAGNRLIDVRSPQEFSGERLHMPDYPNEGALRGGHIPGALNVPWAKAVNEDGTFKNAADLRTIYESDASPDSDQKIVTYCRIGERSSHTWFVLRYLLGYMNVKNYDGSWTEWGNSVGLPIER